MQMDPHVSHMGRPEAGRRPREEVAFAIEPIVSAGAAEIRTDTDG